MMLGKLAMYPRRDEAKYILLYNTINSKGIGDLNIRPQALIVLQEDIGKTTSIYKQDFLQKTNNTGHNPRN